MARKVSFRQKRLEAPEWIFRWKSPGEPLLPKLFAIFGVFAMFALVLSSVRIRAASRNPLEIRKASCILATHSGDGRALALAALENGPFPSRFEPDAWLHENHLGNPAWAALAWQPASHSSELRPLAPPHLNTNLRLAPGGEPVFPKFSPSTPPADTRGVARSPHPVLRILADLDRENSPSAAPWTGTVDPKWLGGSWRFLLHLDASGTVLEFLSMADGADNTVDVALAPWLCQHRFSPAPSNHFRWVGVAVTFENLPDHGPVAH